MSSSVLQCHYNIIKMIGICIILTVFITLSGVEAGTAPPFIKIGCPPVNLVDYMMTNQHPQYCFYRELSCLPNKMNYPDIPKNNNVYRIIRARSWFFCGEYKDSC